MISNVYALGCQLLRRYTPSISVISYTVSPTPSAEPQLSGIITHVAVLGRLPLTPHEVM